MRKKPAHRHFARRPLLAAAVMNPSESTLLRILRQQHEKWRMNPFVFSSIHEAISASSGRCACRVGWHPPLRSTGKCVTRRPRHYRNRWAKRNSRPYTRTYWWRHETWTECRPRKKIRRSRVVVYAQRRDSWRRVPDAANVAQRNVWLHHIGGRGLF